MDSDSIKSIKILCNCTGVDIRDMGIETAVRATLKTESTELPEEIADLFVLAVIEVGGEYRAVLTMA